MAQHPSDSPIVDAHVHLGRDVLHGRDTTGSDVIEAMDRSGVDAAVVQPGHDNTHPGAMVQAHDAIAVLARDYPGRVFGVCAPNPHLTPADYEAEVRRCVVDLRFVGVKVHPVVHAWHPLGRDGAHPFKVAGELGIPVMVHTGTGMPFSLPITLLPVARQFPAVRIILAHAGAAYYGNECLLVAQECPNVYLETSRGADMRTIRKFVKTLGADRILFGSDGLDEMVHALWMYRHSVTRELHWEGLTDAELGACLGDTACRVFGIGSRLRTYMGPVGKR